MQQFYWNLLEGDKFMPEIHLRQPEFTYSAYVQIKKKKKKYNN